MSHAREPWEVREVDGMVSLCGADRWVMDEDPALDRDFKNLADAKRIVACVNACADLTNEELKDILSEGVTLKKMLGVVHGKYEAAEAKVREVGDALAFIEKLDVNPGKTSLSAQERISLAGRSARAALAKLAEAEKLHGTV